MLEHICSETLNYRTPLPLAVAQKCKCTERHADSEAVAGKPFRYHYNDDYHNLMREYKVNIFYLLISFPTALKRVL